MGKFKQIISWKGVWLLCERVADWGQEKGIGRKLAVALAIAALSFALATYLTFTGLLAPIAGTSTVLFLLQIDLALFLLLGVVVARNLLSLWIERRRGRLGSRLQSRLVLLFSLIALAPAILVSVFSAFFFNFSMDNWFSERVKTAIIESRAVATAYLEEHQQVIKGDILSIERDLQRALALMVDNPRKFSQLLAAQGMVRNLSEIFLFDGTGRILTKWSLGFVLDKDPVSQEVLKQARVGDVVLLTSQNDDRLRAVVKMSRLVDTFLYVARFVEPRVLEHIEKTERAAAEYKDIEGQRSSLEITFAMMFILVTLLLLFAAIWVGLVFANRLSRPISELANTAERIKAGDLAARVKEGPETDELGLLSRAFNRMTDQLEGQRLELLQANQQLEERRNFMETVLAGVSAGVVGLDEKGNINLANRSASSLLATNIQERVGDHIGEVVPEFRDLIPAFYEKPNRLIESQLSMERNGYSKTLFVRLSVDMAEGKVVGFVITFDDITELVAVQRKAAWADVARRIAHEIKNPLTPIQLSAERLQRKYEAEILSDPETFSNCTETIIRQVSDIGRMVDEFSAFARMPRPQMRIVDIGVICEEALVLLINAHSEIAFDYKAPSEPIFVSADSGQIAQVLTNVIQNAIDAIEGREEDGNKGLVKGRITLNFLREGEFVLIEVLDNGRGLPTQDRDRLTEPYVTTRTKGTGLGLAIVKTILEDHGGKLTLSDRDGLVGAKIVITIPIYSKLPIPVLDVEGKDGI